MKFFKGTLLDSILILIGACVLCSCSAPPQEALQAGPASVRVIVTLDFGQELVFDETVRINTGATAVDALQKAARVETRYGGGFIHSINGISSEYGGANSRKKDWFFYINGIASNVGARDYVLREGDVEHWDFRSWSYQQFIPAVISSYPQSFLIGFKAPVLPTVVVYGAPFQPEAERIRDNLKQVGVSQVSAVSADQLPGESREQVNLIIIAGTQDKIISELNNLHKRLGFYAYIEDGNIVVLDSGGKKSRVFNRDCGLIQATQNPWNPNGIGAGESVVWMVTGTNTEGVRGAANALIKNRGESGYAFAVVISEGTTLKIP